MGGFIGEVRLWSTLVIPKNWLPCDGQLIQIGDNPALYSIIGNRYGGDGRRTFALPDLRGATAMHPGTGKDEKGNDLTTRTLGQKGGQSEVKLKGAQLPQHTHTVVANKALGNVKDPSKAVWGRGTNSYRNTAPSKGVAMHPDAITVTGQGKPHDNMQPYLVLQYIICVAGAFPQK